MNQHPVIGMRLAGQGVQAVQYRMAALFPPVGAQQALGIEQRTGNLAFVSRLGMEQRSDVVELAVPGLRIERRLAVIARRAP